MNITSGRQKRAVGDSGERYAKITRIKEMPRSLCPSGIAVYNIPVSKIHQSTASGRKTYSPESIAALAQSINKYGVIQPLSVRTLPDGNYELICGERRLRAVRLLGHTGVNCIVISSDKQRSDAMMLCDNIQTEKMHYLDIAESMGKLSSKYSLDVSSVAAKLCVAERFAKDKLRLLEYTDEQRRAIREAGLSEHQATSVLHVEDAEIRAKLLLEVISRRLDERTTDELVLAYLKKRLKKTVPKSSTCLIRDIRIFYNTIERALDVMRSAGYRIGAEKHEDERGSTITITIPKDLL